MRRACRPSPAWLRWAVFVCAAALLAPRPAVGQCDGPSFGSSPFAPGDPVTQPRGLVVGDFYGPLGVLDGKPDVVVTRDPDQVSILEGAGDGSFGLPPHIDTTVGIGPKDLVAGNFDPNVGPNAYLDIALIPATPPNTVQLLSGNGLGFIGPSDLDVGMPPSRLAVGDFNRDGLLDLVVVSDTAGLVMVYRGDGLLGFTLFSAQPSIPNAPADVPTSAVAGDFDEDGNPDLAVTVATMIGPDQVQVFLGDGTGALGDGVGGTGPYFAIDVGMGPIDIVAGDITRNGTLDLATADSAGTATVLSGTGSGDFNLGQTVATGLTTPRRVELTDFDRDGIPDLAVHDDGAQAVVVYAGSGGVPIFYEGVPRPPVLVALGTVSTDLAVADFDLDGWDDLLAADDLQVTWIPNNASPNCLRTSFLDAPRAFAGGDGPVSLAVGDLDEDGIDDLVAAAQYGGSLELLRGTGGGYVPNGSVSGIPTPRGVVAADFDVNGHVDVAVAAGTEVRVYPGNGDGTLGIPSTVDLGAAVLALVVGDFDEDGAPDVAATTQVPAQVRILQGNGLGDLLLGPVYATGGFPRSLATGRVDDANMTLDIVVGNSALGGGVTILLGNGDGTFNEPGWSPYDTTLAPWGVALADFDGDARLDLATADHDASRISISRWIDTPTGFDTASFLGVMGQPIAVAALNVTAPDTDADVMVVTGDNHTLSFRRGNGNLTFQGEVWYPARTRPSTIVPVDADADGLPDVAVPCRDADSIVVFIARSPSFAQAPMVIVGDTPTGIATGDLDSNGSLDLAVVNSVDDTVTILDNDGFGAFTPRAAPPEPVGAKPEAVVIADFDRNGVLDLATSNVDSANVSVLFGTLTPVPAFAVAQNHDAETAPDDLVVADFDRDGDPDIAVCNKLSPGQITFLDNDGAGDFTKQGPLTLAVGENEPTSIVSADFNGDGLPDVAVANDNSNNLTVLYNDATWLFPTRETLVLVPGDTSPVSLAAGDFDHDGDVDLVVVASGSSYLSLYENTGGAFSVTPTRYDASHLPLFVTAADLNRDGRLDAAVAAEGVKVLPGRDGLDFEPSEDVIAGRQPRELVVGDFDRDGRPDVAVTNELQNRVSILRSSACLPRRLVLGMSPGACGSGTPPYPISATVRIEDDGGNVAICKNDTDIHAAIVPGTGTVGAVLGGTVDVLPSMGAATFGDLTIDLAGPRYQLEFELPPIPKVLSRSFTLGASVAITGPPSVCTSEVYTADPGFDSYHWTLTPSPTPERFGPSTSVSLSDLVGSKTLDVVARVDGCEPMNSKNIYVGDLFSVTISPAGPVTVCVDCLGGPVTVTDVGGGALTRQWGYRTAPGPGPITDIDGQTGETYVINGQDFPGVGTFYLVETTTPQCGTATTSNEVAVTITETVPGGEVRSLGVTSRGPSGVDGEHVLQWVNTTGTVEENLVRWNKAPTDSSLCSPPADTLAPFDDEISIMSPPPLSIQKVTNNGVELNTAYCYSVFVKVSGAYSPGRTVKARAIDTSSGPVRWNYATGATAVVAPTVSEPGIVVLSNDRTIHLLTRSIRPIMKGGEWAAGWSPPSVFNGLAHMRSPVVPFVVPRGVNVASDTILFAADDTGQVHAVNAATGQFPWFAPEAFTDTIITGAPGGLFAQWNGGPPDVVLVGTHSTLSGTGVFYTLNVDTGDMIDSFSPPGLGPINSAPAADYVNDRVYFTSWSRFGTNPSVWCVEIDAAGMISAAPLPWAPPNDMGDIDVSPVLLNGRLYVANNAGEVYSVDATTGAPGPPFPTSDGPVKGFLFPDFRNNDLYFTTSSTVWSVRDTAGTLTANWTWRDLPGLGIEPSIVLHWPGTDFLYIGSRDGRLVQLDFSVGAPVDPCTPPSCHDVVLGDGADHIGAPSLDIGVVPPEVTPGKKLLLAGSESGVLHAVEVPLP